MQDIVGLAGPGAMLTLVIVAIVKGMLVPRSVLEDVRKDRDARLQEVQAVADMWKEAFQESDKRSSILAEQNRELLQQGRTTNSLIAAIPKAVEKAAS